MISIETNMSEVNADKAEKQRKRQEQLAKWKSKKAPLVNENSLFTSKIGPIDCGTGSLVDPKKLERLKKLEEWKRKRLQVSELAGLEDNSKNEVGATLSTSSARLDAWKKRRTDLTDFKTSLLLKVKFRTQRNSPVLSQSLFNDTEETDDVLRIFKKPTLENGSSKLLQPPLKESDSLDAFLETLEPTENGLAHVNNIEPALEASDSEALDDNEDQKLLSSKMKNLQKEKALQAVDHDQVDYSSFRKSFYHEPESVKSLSPEEVELLRVSMDGIKVSGSNIPAPIWEWHQLGLSSLVVSILEDDLRFNSPTPIQSQALPAIMSGRDFLGIAKTGSGKTLGFLLPLLRHVQDQPPLAKGEGPIGILLTPTRELALQIFKILSLFAKKLSISIACCYGGSSIEPQIAELKKGSQIVVATPGRLIDLLAANGGRVCNLKRVTYVVLDEADRMFDFGFEPQVKKIFSQIRPDRQSILFSATFAKKMEQLAKAILIDPIEVIVGGISVVPPEITQHVEFFPLKENETEQEISAMKFELLIGTLSKYPGVKKLVFVEKQESADKLLVKLIANNLHSVVIHGGKEQIDRKYAIKDFSEKDSGIDIMLATSIAARGLDVKGLDLVINYDPASHMEDYVHRVGRTGRAGSKGDAYTFVTSAQERAVTDLVKAMRLSQIPDADIDERLIAIADKFMKKVKEGKEKYRFGFGGKGLTKLDEARRTNQVMERRAYEGDSALPAASVKSSSSTPATGDSDSKLELPEFKIIEGKADESSGPDKCKFHSRITINDLPQKTRWTVVNAESLAQIIETTSTSITNKGQFYPPGSKVPTMIKQGGREIAAPPKLYLLIEGLTEASVKEANRLIRQKMIEGLDQAGLDEQLAPSGKYTV